MGEMPTVVPSLERMDLQTAAFLLIGISTILFGLSVLIYGIIEIGREHQRMRHRWDLVGKS